MADPSCHPAGSPGSPSGDLHAGASAPDAVVRGSAPGAARTSSPDAAPESFERALAELEQIVQRMESGSLSLEDSLIAYRRGASLVGYCRESLADVQQQVRILEADLLRPFEVDVRNGGDAGEGPR